MDIKKGVLEVSLAFNGISASLVFVLVIVVGFITRKRGQNLNQAGQIPLETIAGQLNDIEDDDDGYEEVEIFSAHFPVASRTRGQSEPVASRTRAQNFDMNV